jgi:DNA processing protein
MDQNRLSLLALHFIPGVGDYLVRQLISYCGSAEKVFKTPKGKLMKVPGVGAVTAQSIANGKPFREAEREIVRAEDEGVELLFFTDKKFPSRLKRIDDAPSLLYVKGNINFENPKVIAIVGTRQATAYGRERVDELINGLVTHNALIVSGLAYGIDIHAHKQSLKYNLPTVGVMGSGIDIIYPQAHRETAKKMIAHGGLVTENPFGTKPDAHNFPARNRIIAGLCDALVVVEAAERGGALITSEIANSYNKDVFAFPGNIGQSHSAGCNNLIKMNKASLVTGIRDIEYIMNWTDSSTDKKKVVNTINFETLEPEEKRIVDFFREAGGQLTIDELSWRSNHSVSQLASLLLAMEFKGAVSSLPGKVYKILA